MKALPIAISAIALTLTSVTFAATVATDRMGDKTVTRAEAEARAREVFARLDVNHDGKLDKADREGRDLSAEERHRFDRTERQVKRLEVDIDDLEGDETTAEETEELRIEREGFATYLESFEGARA